jgi:hypothetical protein
VQVTVTGREDRAVTITAVDLIVTKRVPALAGVVVSNPCGGPGESPFLEYNLDGERPRLLSSASVPMYKGDDHWRFTPMRYPWTVTKTDTVTLTVFATTESHTCDWILRVKWRSGEEEGESKLGTKEEPFRVAAVAGSKRYVSDMQSKGWSELE